MYLHQNTGEEGRPRVYGGDQGPPAPRERFNFSIAHISQVGVVKKWREPVNSQKKIRRIHHYFSKKNIPIVLEIKMGGKRLVRSLRFCS